MKVIIAGSRQILDYTEVLLAIERASFKGIYPITEIVCGKAKGPDTLGEQYGIENNISIKYFPAEWDKFGKRAGYIRNEQMAKYADASIILWDGISNGTRHMIKLSKQNRLITYINRL